MPNTPRDLDWADVEADALRMKMEQDDADFQHGYETGVKTAALLTADQITAVLVVLDVTDDPTGNTPHEPRFAGLLNGLADAAIAKG